jgi:phosphonate transport system substrate-binding protein
MAARPLRFATFLAPSIFPTYQFIAQYVGQQLGLETELTVGRSFSQFAEGEADVGFICGLPYILLMREDPPLIDLLAAPVLLGDRYAGRPIYFSDVIVRASSQFTTFADLRGCTWSYNDPDSHSGYGVTRYHLARMGETRGFFGRVVEAGFHQESIQLVRRGEVDASAIDSQVLAVAMRDDPDLIAELRVIDSLGPSSIQPVVAASRLPDSLKADLRAALLSMHENPAARERLAAGLFDRFAAVTDSDYDDLREMLALAEQAGFMVIK